MSETPSPPNANLPSHPRYAAVEKIAQGDFATLFRGRDLELNREVAIKQIHEQYLADPHQLDRYWQEAQLIANLEHPRIITIYDIVRDRGWLILELMMGSIQEILKGRPIDLTDLRYLLKAMALGLQFLERNGIVHGDVKPSNMLVDKNRQLRLGDFGIARRLATDDGSVVKGTAKYMAPEVVSDQFGPPGPHSDLYSLGFSAYELMCGRNFESLFPGLNMFGRDRQIAWMMWQSAPDRRLPQIHRVLQNVPENLAQIVEKLCEKDPAKRYRTAEEVLGDLEEDKVRDKRPAAVETAEAEQAVRQQRRKRLLSVGALVLSLTLSVGLALWPSSKETPPPPPPKELSQGTLVLVDLPNRRLQLRPASGPVGDVPFDPQQDMFVLNETQLLTVDQLQPGDPVSVKRMEADGKIQRIFGITRAQEMQVQGAITAVESASQRIAILPQGAGRQLPEIFVPSNVSPLLNGEPVALAALRPNDRVIAKYLPDRDGLKALSIDAQRMVEVKGAIEAVHLPSSEVTIRRGDASTVDLAVDSDCRVFLNGLQANAQGLAFGLADLRKDDEVTVQHDRTVHRIDAQRVLIVEGTVERADGQRRVVDVRQTNQVLRSLALAEDCTVHLDGGEKVEFAALRPGDAVRIVEDSRDGRARRIEAVFAPDRGLWALVIAPSRHDNRQVTPSQTAHAGADLVRRTLLQHARLPQEQLLWLPDATRFGAQTATADFLRRIPAEGRLIAYVAAHATKSEQGDVYLALRDFDPSRPRETGLDLALLLDGLDAVPASQKVLLFDVQHGGEEGRWQPAAGELLESLKARRGRVSHSVHVIANCSQGEVDVVAEGGQTGAFASCMAAALTGKADFDRDHQLTPAELFRCLKIEVATCALRSGQEQNPLLFSPSPRARFDAETLTALRTLLQLAREGGKLDDQFALLYHQAVALSPDQPDAQILYGLAMLKDKMRSKLAQERLEQVAARYPEHFNTPVAYHALAWLHFRNQDYDRGLERLEQAVSRLPDPSAAYAKHLFAFAGRLSTYAHRVVADPKLRPRLSQVFQAVSRHGEPATQAFRQSLDAMQKEIESREQQVAQAETPAQRATLELRRKNLNEYVEFEFPIAFSAIEESLTAGR